jgi:hypothetical protein
MCTIPSKNWRGFNFNIDDYKGKKTSTDENYFYYQFEYIWLKNVFDPENYGF